MNNFSPAWRLNSRSKQTGIARLATLIGVPDASIFKLVAEVPAHYRTTLVKESTKVRKLLIPLTELKLLQRRILSRVLSKFPQHSASHCRRGRSILTNARVHSGHDYVSAFDLRDAFPSIRPHVVRASLRRALRARSMPEELAQPIASLCTVNGQLPQGAPTSTAILDIVLYSLDEELSRAAKLHGLVYSRYVDDLTVSGGRPHAFFGRIVASAVGKMGLHLNTAKGRSWGPRSRATITGLVLGASPLPQADYLRQVTAIASRYGRDRASLTTKELASLRGHVAWVRQVNPRIGKRLERIMGGG